MFFFRMMQSTPLPMGGSESGVLLVVPNSLSVDRIRCIHNKGILFQTLDVLYLYGCSVFMVTICHVIEQKT